MPAAAVRKPVAKWRPRTPIVLAAIVIAAAGAVALVAWLVATAELEVLRVGRKLYAVHCASCHGKELEGQPDWQTPKPDGRLPAPPHDASGHTWHHSDSELFEITKRGMSAVVPGHASDMPGFHGTLTDEEIRVILEFIKSTWPAKEREYQKLRTKQSKEQARSDG